MQSSPSSSGTARTDKLWSKFITVDSTVPPRVYRPAEGEERACNSRTSCIEGEMLAVTKFKSRNDAV